MYIFGMLALLLVGCDKEDSTKEYPLNPPKRVELNDNIYYVTGVQSQALDLEENGSLKAREYLFISENLKDTVCVENFVKEGDRLLTGDLLDDLFDIPTTVLWESVCGLTSFSPEYRYAYKVRIISWREPEINEYPIYICRANMPSSSIRPNRGSIIVESIAKGEESQKEDPREGVDVPFSEYSLDGTSSSWLDLEDYRVPPETILINDDEELQKYVVRYIYDQAIYPIPYVYSTDYPPIDFTKYSLLLTRFQEGRGVARMTYDFDRLSEGRYRLDIDVFLSDTNEAPYFAIALLVDKLSEDSEVELKKTTFEYVEKEGWKEVDY